MKFFFIPFFLVMFSFAVFAQPKIFSGPQYKGTSSDITHIIGSDNEYIYLVREKLNALKNVNYLLEAYHKDNLVLKEQYKIDLPRFNGSKQDYLNAYVINGKLTIFGKVWPTMQDPTYSLIYQTLSANGELSAPVLLSTVPEEYCKMGLTKGDISFSPDGSKMLLVADPLAVMNIGASDDMGYYVEVFDDKLNTLWKKEINLPYRVKQFYTEFLTIEKNERIPVEVSNDGDIIITTYFAEGSESKYKVIRIKYKGEKFNIYDVGSDGIYINQVRSKINKEGDLIIAGYFSQKNKYNVKGIYYRSIDLETDKVLTESFTHFDDNTLSHFLKKREIEKGKELEYLYLDKMMIKDDGTIILTGEPFIINEGSESAFSSILVTNINKNGKVIWNTWVPKIQVSKPNQLNLASYFAVLDHEDLYIFYNDIAKNLSVTKGKPDKVQYYVGSVTMARINVKGDLNKALLTDANSGDIFTPRSAYQVNSKEIVIVGENRSKYRLQRITL